MQNYKMLLQYEGSRYQGWQRQDSTENTIQGKLECLLTKMTEQKVEINGSGRTDAGVHAKGQVMNAFLSTDKTCEEIRDYMNRYLPEDISVWKVEKADERFHARLLAKGKTYEYRIWNSAIPNVFERKFLYPFPEKMDMEAMKTGADYLCGTHDFKAFTSTKKGKKSTIRTVEAIEIQRMGEEIRFTFRGDGFLYHMVRIMTGTLLEIGLGKKAPEDIPAILESKKRENAGFLVPGQGLTLVEVRYGNDEDNGK